MQINQPNNLSVVFLPDYLIPTFKAVGLGLSEIDQLFNNNEESYEARNQKVKTILENISKKDISDLSIANSLMDQYFLGRNNDGYRARDINRNFVDRLTDELGLWYYNDSKEFNDFVNYYADGTIIMSGDSVDKTYEFVTHSNTLFIVLHRGFTNFITCNNLEFIEHFNNLLLKHLLVNFGEEVVYNNEFLFKSLLKQI